MLLQSQASSRMAEDDNQMSFHKSYEAAKAAHKPMKRGWIKPRFNKKPSVDGDHKRAIGDDCDQLVREILELRDDRCVTCPATEGLQVGHFFKRGKHRVRWDLLNVHRQCPPCNKRHNEEPEHYLEAFLMKHGEQAYAELRKRNNGPPWSYMQMLSIRDGLRNEFTKLKGKTP